MTEAGSSLIHRADPSDGGSIIGVEIHLAKRPDLLELKPTEPTLTILRGQKTCQPNLSTYYILTGLVGLASRISDLGSKALTRESDDVTLRFLWPDIDMCGNR